ncbi:hypothetical protein A0H81_09277 [Grifola frondosa]|uniref:GDP/GTP exchange factor Sec2 N-terminal domain-containing protein n=1 Tax=Grifola frondosa TaxID=5627 RepID=A0A1C7M2I3_GRIFR|nr:hypothetical protein A0H81_09277 [Grifola frondosa]
MAPFSQRVAPKSIRPEPILPRLPIPVLTSSDSEFSESAPESIPADPSATLLPAEETTRTDQPSATLLPTSIAKASSEATPTFLQNSTALQEELSAQLAQMATQLKRNAQHFAGSLEKDKAVVLEAQEKLERNHDVMTKERVR